MQKIDYRLLKQTCLADIESFASYGVSLGTPDEPLFYKDNGANILAVAHLDTVQNTRHFSEIAILNGNQRSHRVLNGQLDDRLGVYGILYYLPSLGIKDYDVLLTTGEESMHSTASQFDTGKQYHWMFSLDRAGTDVVMYQYDNKDTRARVKSVSATVGNGSYSDIADLWYLGCCGFNWGVGYYANHSDMSYMVEGDFTRMMRQFSQFYRKYKDCPMPFEGREHRRYTYAYGDYYERLSSQRIPLATEEDDDDDINYGDCMVCHSASDLFYIHEYDTVICGQCLDTFFEPTDTIERLCERCGSIEEVEWEERHRAPRVCRDCKDYSAGQYALAKR